MRITENRLIDLATKGLEQARDGAARAGDVLSSGLRVDRPSDDPVAWAEGMRARGRDIRNEARTDSAKRAAESFNHVEASLETVSQVLSRAAELAVQMANASYDAPARAAAAIEIRALRENALGVANVRGADGEYLLAGLDGDAPAFDAAGVYQGDSGNRVIEADEQARVNGNVSGARLTTLVGEDVLATLTELSTALDNNDAPALSGVLDKVNRSIDQVSRMRGEVGSRLEALRFAEDTRLALHDHLEGVRARAVASDPVESASELARATNALEVARSAAERLVELARPGL